MPRSDIHRTAALPYHWRAPSRWSGASSRQGAICTLRPRGGAAHEDGLGGWHCAAAAARRAALAAPPSAPLLLRSVRNAWWYSWAESSHSLTHAFPTSLKPHRGQGRSSITSGAAAALFGESDGNVDVDEHGDEGGARPRWPSRPAGFLERARLAMLRRSWPPLSAGLRQDMGMGGVGRRSGASAGIAPWQPRGASTKRCLRALSRDMWSQSAAMSRGASFRARSASRWAGRGGGAGCAAMRMRSMGGHRYTDRVSHINMTAECVGDTGSDVKSRPHAPRTAAPPIGPEAGPCGPSAR